MIFYFSATGNTAWAAHCVAQELKEELIAITENNNVPQEYTLSEGERLGFCFPVHGWRPPLYVQQFIEKLTVKLNCNTFVWALCTAGDNIGETMHIFADCIKNRNIKLDASYSLIMPESYVGLPFMDVDSLEREQKKKEQAEKVLKACIEKIRNKETGEFNLITGNFPKLNSRLLGKFFSKVLITDKRFRIDPNRCIACGLCVRTCPVNNIAAEPGNLLRWLHNGKCLTCFACYHHCPKHAIEFGSLTKGKGQYYFEKNKKGM